MCISNNQSGNPSRENTLHYDRDQLARDLLETHVFIGETLGDALHGNLGHIKELCQTIQQVCLASPEMDRIDIASNDLHGFLVVVVNEINVAALLADRLSSLEMRFNSETRKYQQTQHALDQAQEQIANHEEYILELESQISSKAHKSHSLEGGE